MKDIGSKLRELRKNSGLTQYDLANKLYVSDKTISSWENGRTLPDINTLFKIASIFNVSFYELVYNNYGNKDNIELEVKLKVDENEYNRVLDIVKARADYIDEEIHIATYYEPIFRNFNHEYLRIRNENGKNVLNYKKDMEGFGCNEYETIIDNAVQLDKILNSLGYKKSKIIEKKRKKYLYNHIYEISFDEVKNIGLFIEIEVKNKKDSNLVEYEKLMNFLLSLNINLELIDNKHYPDYLKSLN